MRVQFNVSGYDLAPSLRKLIEQHFRFAASPFRSSLQAIHVKLSDVAESGAGAAKRCEAELHLRNGGVTKRSNGRTLARSTRSNALPNGSSARSRAYGGAGPTPWYHVQRNAIASHPPRSAFPASHRTCSSIRCEGRR